MEIITPNNNKNLGNEIIVKDESLTVIYLDDLSSEILINNTNQSSTAEQIGVVEKSLASSLSEKGIGILV